MATLAATMLLTRVVLSEVVEQANVVPRTVVAGSASSISGGASQPKVDETNQSGTFRSYGNGNTRLVLGAAQTRTQPVALIALSPTQVQTLRNLIGHTVCLRDTYGRKMFGSYLDIQVSAIPLSGSVITGTLLQSVALTLQNVTYSEGV